MKVSVVVCTYSQERFQDVLEAVASVLRQPYGPKEVIVAVDCNSALAAHLKTQLGGSVSVVLNSAERGLSHTRNAGIRAANGDVIAFLDDDAVMAGDWLDLITAQFQDPQVMGAGGRSVPRWLGPEPAWLPEELYWIVGSTYGGFHRGRAQVRNVHGSNMVFRRRAFEAAGLFAGRVGYRRNLVSGEETEFCIRLRQAIPDAWIIYEPRAVVYHKVPPSRLTLKYLVRRAYGEGVGKGYISLLYRGRADTITDERAYLRHLMRYMGEQVGQALSGGGIRLSLMRAGAVALAVVATGLGYWLTVATGWLRRWPKGAVAPPLLEPQTVLTVGGEDA